MSSSTPETAEEYLARQDAEWSQFVAVQDIYHNGVLAARVGDPIPASNVSAHGYDEAGLVAKTTTKAAKAAISKDAS